MLGPDLLFVGSPVKGGHCEGSLVLWDHLHDHTYAQGDAELYGEQEEGALEAVSAQHGLANQLMGCECMFDGTIMLVVVWRLAVVLASSPCSQMTNS